MSKNPLRVLILRLNNDVAHAVVERILREFPTEYAASIGVRERWYASLAPDAQRWFSSSDIRGGDYAGVREEELLPLDEELIERMRGCETVFFHMVARIEFSRRFSFEERKRMYYKHLRVWNDLIERRKINLFLSGIMPHEIPDHLIYCLCKVKGIPTVFFHATPIRDRAYLMTDWQDPAPGLRARFEELSREYAGRGIDDIALEPALAEYFRKQSDVAGREPIKFRRPTPVDRIMRLIRSDLPGAVRAFVQWTPTLLSVTAWRRRVQKIAARRELAQLRTFYDRHATSTPDFSQPFLYVPLHFQPEASTAPMAGAFVDQLVTLQLLSASAPPGVLLYVKEHPKQHTKGFACRSISFYESLLALPNVRFLAHDVSSFALREHCRGVATATGTAGFEALFRGKPVLLFGHPFYHEAPGVFRIHTADDCRAAMAAIFERGERPDVRDVKIFLRALQETSVHASVTDWHQLQASDLSAEQNTAAIAGALAEGIRNCVV